MKDTDNILSQADTARLLKVSRAYINQLLNAGRLTVIEIGNRKFIVSDQKLKNLIK